MKFSIMVVALNAGDKLKKTVESVLTQTYGDYEIVVKDGGSRDGSVDALPKDGRIRLFAEPDSGIYDAMNQAVAKAQGDYILFLNCGDIFYDESVLEKTAKRIEREQGEVPLVLYGDTYGAKNNVLISSPKEINGFACYRNIPCHQSCFYAAELCREKPFNPEYRIRADYDHFLWCYYQAKAKMVYMDFVVSDYEGGGYSESPENRRRDKEEHRQITEQYMSPAELARYRRTMLITLAPLRSLLAENRLTSGIYHWLKDCIYHHKMRIFLGALFLIIELALFFGSGIMLEEVDNYLTGEGSWEVQMSEEVPTYRQAFVPKHSHLYSLSFLMNMDQVSAQDGAVQICVSDKSGQILFEETREFSEITDGSFTDVKVDLELAAGKSYYLSLTASPSSAGEYPAVSVCSTDYKLPENRNLVSNETFKNTQLVSRYHYQDALTAARAGSIIFLCLLTALGIMFGLPDDKNLRRAVGIGILVAAPLVLGRHLELLTYNETCYLPFAMRWNIGIMYVLELLILLCTHSTGAAIILTNAGLTLLYSANYFLLMFRGTALRINDFSAVGTAAAVAGNYSFAPDGPLAVVWGMFLLLAVFGVQTGMGKNSVKQERHKRLEQGRRFWIRKLVSYGITIGLAVIIACFGSYQLISTDLLERRGFADSDTWGISYGLIDFNGYLVGTCIDIKNSRIEEPTGYSVEAVRSILANVGESAQEVSEEELPHIILIMNESFSDLRVLGNPELADDNMPFLHSLQENTIQGYVNASVLGGGTANSEFEVLTGCSMAFFPTNYYPYQQVLRGSVNSMVSRLEQYGYITYSMHAAPGTSWNRAEVYRYLGFDSSFWKADFADAEVIHYGASDAANYDKIIELYEDRQPGEKQFIFDVTIQNHGGYTDLEEYLSLVKVSDEAFEELVGYFEKQDENVIICMFGDHQPGLSKQVVQEEGTTQEQLMNMYKTPFVIWANYDIEEESGYDISMNYLGGLLMRTAGVPLSTYFSYLEELRESYPIITVNGYADNEGRYFNWDGTEDEFPEYRILQYYYLYDVGKGNEDTDK